MRALIPSFLILIAAAATSLPGLSSEHASSPILAKLKVAEKHLKAYAPAPPQKHVTDLVKATQDEGNLALNMAAKSLAEKPDLELMKYALRVGLQLAKRDPMVTGGAVLLRLSRMRHGEFEAALHELKTSKVFSEADIKTLNTEMANSQPEVESAPEPGVSPGT